MRKTSIEDLKDFAKKMQGDCLSEVYTNDRAKYLWKDKDGNEWEDTWRNVKRKKSFSKNIRINSLKDIVEFAKRKNYKVLTTKYYGAKYKYYWLDKNLNIWKSSITNIKRSNGNKFEFADKCRTYTIKDLKEFAQKMGGKCLSDKYINNKTKYVWEDKNGNQWKASWNNIKNGKHWDYRKRFDLESLVKFAKKKKYKVLTTKYYGVRHSYYWVDENLNIWKNSFWNIKKGQENRFQYGVKTRKYTIKDLSNYARSKGGWCLSTEYTNNSKRYLFCDSNLRTWRVNWASVLFYNSWSPFESNSTSKGEMELIQYIRQFYPEARKHFDKYELDVLIPKLNIAFEYNGLYWHSEKFKDKKYHKDKSEYFKNKNIQVIYIREDQWKNKNKIVKDFIKYKLNKSSKRIYARNCLVKKIDKKEAMAFHDNNHLQGSNKHSNLNIGLYYKDELISVMSFGTHHRKNNNEQIVLTRLSYKNDYSVLGGASKLFKFSLRFINNDIISWSDNDYSDGGIYKKLEFKLDAILKEDYFYTNGKDVFSKQKYKKSNLKKFGFSDNVTETQATKELGLLKIFNSGKKRWLYNIEYK